MDAREFERLAEMSQQDPWDRERRFQIDVVGLWGRDSWRLGSALAGMQILNWSHEETGATRIAPFRLRTRPDLLSEVAEVFQSIRRESMRDSETTPAELERYLAQFEAASIRAIGRQDFDRLADFAMERVRGK